MSFLAWLPELLALLLWPWLRVQGKRTRQRTPRMPPASGNPYGVIYPHVSLSVVSTPLEVLAIGESPVAGVGVQHQEESITGQLADALAVSTQRPVAWRAFGQNGATVRETIDALLSLEIKHSADDISRPVHVLLIAFGVNDSTAFHRVQRYRKDLEDLLNLCIQRWHPVLTIVCGVPPLQAFPALPQPLRHVLGLKAAALNMVTKQIASCRKETIYVPMMPIASPEWMAADGYHPSAEGVYQWAKQLADAIMDSSVLRG
ncbi:lysophospholipase L1-like esterase [Herbaspirillum sp. Sphag1AN]|uniref:SGNH/GDSL hydrolase family protein n=1 Tax=unclassified Herbaspirillum TaxID=2624150 RepID=UPI00160CBAC3|nr:MULTISPECIES: SGNH/GDSL hydrolase family protein [unclassified Herbaspirillum]MBB3213968.1 lysophospholipase L1-like esterase [Herbaspirillum sp. Sphag1AN]MBB3247165.1 lysophospholipase L1-like esterase [Herbaspirillum sp. Sphag64]